MSPALQQVIFRPDEVEDSCGQPLAETFINLIFRAKGCGALLSFPFTLCGLGKPAHIKSPISRV